MGHNFFQTSSCIHHTIKDLIIPVQGFLADRIEGRIGVFHPQGIVESIVGRRVVQGSHKSWLIC